MKFFNIFSGWKMRLSGLIIAATPILELLGYGPYADIALRVGEGLGIIGAAHKWEKMGK